MPNNDELEYENKGQEGRAVSTLGLFANRFEHDVN